MNRKVSLSVSLIALTAIAALMIANTGEGGLAGFFTRQHQPWNFIQSAGGMKVTTDGNRLIVVCDVSGLKTVTVKPAMTNSAMAVRELKCSRIGNTLQLSVVTSVIKKGMSSECGSLDLSAHPPGAYSIVYLDPDGTTHPAGTIELPGKP